MNGTKIVIPRAVLLVEIERRCALADCNARTRIGLTKEEAHAYLGFECERCKQWNDDALLERDAPDWWEELTITDLRAIRAGRVQTQEEPDEIVTRMSEDYRRVKRDEGDL
ncbi:MAG: hypothetical protein WCF57_16050 [Pyrinomonadaceae bacterium]